MTKNALKLVKRCFEKKLDTLDLGNCAITDEDLDENSPLSVELGKCTQLRSLTLSNSWYDAIDDHRIQSKNSGSPNRLSKLPSCISNLTSLNSFICAGDSSEWRIRDFTSLATLSKLEYLDLSFNNLSNSIVLAQLINLISLNARQNSLTEIEGIVQLNKLKHLHLGVNEIGEIKGLQNLPHLEVLDLNSNQIKEIKGLESLSSLKDLSLANNQIAEIKGLNGLHNLRYLFLSNNNISEIKGLEDLNDLTLLSLTSNIINEIKGLEKLQKLRYLFISRNNIENISGLKHLPNLFTLYIGSNLIKETETFKHLIQLRSLGINSNQITDLQHISKLILTELDIRDNKIKDISPLIPWLNKPKNSLKIIWNEASGASIDEINVYGNPLTIPPVTIVKQGNESILRYFEKIKNEGIDSLFEAKLTLVGEGSAGKTSLQKRLVKPNSSLPKRESRTRGIKIVDWKYKGKNNKTHIAHIWDFGGQDVYYPVHRFFLTEKSVFVLLASTRQTHHNFDYWIPTIFQFGGKSPIILGQTCHQGNKVSWTDINYYLANENFNIIKTGLLPYVEINLLNDNEGLSEIRKSIIDQIEKLPHYGKGVPKSWVSVRQKIYEEAKKNACISFYEFENICKNASTDSFALKTDIEDLGVFLHSLGIILWYSENDDLKNWVILQPEWAMNAVYKIIDDGKIQKRRGHIQSSDFTRIWVDSNYQNKFDILKRMLQVFKIAFPKKHKRNDFLIPARLLSMPKELKWNSDRAYLRLVYKYDFMPKGLVNQLSADLSRNIKSDNEIWNNAVNFEHADTNAQAQVIEDFYDRSISINATGKDARGLLMIIIDAMKDVIDGYKEVQPKIFVPCSCEMCKISESPTFFEYAKLLKWSANKSEVHCNEGDVKLHIEELIYNVGLPSSVNQEKDTILKNRRGPLKTFISYSKFDGESSKDGINYLNQFKKHLAPLSNFNNLIQPWDDTLLIAGEDWDERIKEALNTSDIIFLLVSPDFLSTNYIIKTELEIAIERHNNKNCIVVPIIIRKCGWIDVKTISKLSAIPRKGEAIASWEKKWPTIDDAWNDVYEEVKRIILGYTGNQNTITKNV